jgi:hypothetical protein
LVWHGVNNPANLRQFLASEVHWAEVDARLDPIGDRVIPTPLPLYGCKTPKDSKGFVGTCCGAP